jgi:branched-chain amino acid transport system substrate-binding protein
MLFALGAAAQAADVIKLGNLTQLSGALATPGSETKRGIDLALEELDNKLGGVPVKYYPVDDKSNPAEAINGASKLIDELKVDFVTGLGASNTLIPVFKSFVDANILAVGALAGPQPGLQESILPCRRLSGRQGAR